MDANFNYPGTGHLSTDMRVNVFDYAVWIQGYVAQKTDTTPTPTSILPSVTPSGIHPTVTPTPTGVAPTATRTPTPTGNITVTPSAGAKKIFDEVVQFIATDKGFHTIKEDGQNISGVPVNWQSPDYYNGTWYFRYTITQADATPLPGNSKYASGICPVTTLKCVLLKSLIPELLILPTLPLNHLLSGIKK